MVKLTVSALVGTTQMLFTWDAPVTSALTYGNMAVCSGQTMTIRGFNFGKVPSIHTRAHVRTRARAYTNVHAYAHTHPCTQPHTGGRDAYSSAEQWTGLLCHLCLDI